MKQFQVFFKELADIRANIRDPKVSKRIKTHIGDSVNNNRTVTVSQLIRFLNKKGDKKLALQILLINDYLKNATKLLRNKRTDAIDVAELVNSYRLYVMDYAILRDDMQKKLTQVSRKLTKLLK